MILSLKYSGASIDIQSESVRDFPSTLLVAVYDEAIASLTAAIAAIERGDIVGRFDATTQAIDVISELHLALDMKQGGAIAMNLSNLYRFFVSQIPMINILNDAAIAAELINMLQQLRASWAEVDDRIRCEVEAAEALERAMYASSVVQLFPKSPVAR